MIKGYTTVILDLYGVVLQQSRSSLIDFAMEKNPDLETDNANELFQKAICGEIPYDEFLNSLKIRNTDITKYIDNNLSLHEGFIEFAEAFKDKYSLVLMANNLAELNQAILEKFSICKYFQHIFVSAEMKCAKPKFEIFDRAMEIMGTSPQECIFIDNREKNLLAAEEVGLAPILFENENERYYGSSVYNFKELGIFIG